MITGLVITALFFAVAALLSRLYEARYQLAQVQRQFECEAYARVTLLELLAAGVPVEQTEETVS